jgi:hypothetical protein
MENKTFTLGYHLVAFVDVLGQREKFRQLALPETSEDHAKVGQVLQDTAGFVSALREMFQKQFEAFERGIVSGPLQIQHSVRPRFVGFSDSFVASVPLRNDSGNLVPIITVFSALYGASTIMLTSLAKKHALRGGIDVGLATELGPTEIYGTALERAYVLERDHARYPRVVVGIELWNYLSLALVEFENDQSASARATKAIVQKMTQLISTDDDGQRILDYLGPVLASLMKPAEVEVMVKPAYDFVVSEHERFLSNGDSKLSERYGLLRRYFESRLPQWGLTPSKAHGGSGLDRLKQSGLRLVGSGISM